MGGVVVNPGGRVVVNCGGVVANWGGGVVVQLGAGGWQKKFPYIDLEQTMRL